MLKYVTLLVSVAVICGCGGNEQSKPTESFDSAKPDALRIVLSDEPASLDPHKASLMVEFRVLTYLLKGLVEITPDGKLQPGAAESWTVSDDGLIWDFKLRPDIAWNDGVAMTADDFVYSLRRVIDPATAATFIEDLYDIKNAPEIQRGEKPKEELGVSAPTPSVLRIELSQPNPYLAELLNSLNGMPVPRHVIEKHGDDWVKPANWVGNDTYTLADRVPGDRIDLVSTRPEETDIDNVSFFPIRDTKVAYNRYRAGEVHSIPLLPRDIDLTQHTDDLREWVFSASSTIMFNHELAPFDNINVRRALALAVDQLLITESIAKPKQIPAYGFVPDFVDAKSPKFPAHDPSTLEEAKALLAGAGFTEDNPLSFNFRHTTSVAKAIPVALMGAWQQIGVRVALEGKEISMHYNEVEAGNFQVALTGRVVGARSEQYINEFTSDRPSLNVSRYQNPEVKTLWANLKAEPDKSKREAISRSIQEILIADVAAIPLLFRRGQGLVRPEIQGWEDNYYNVHPLKYLSWEPQVAAIPE